MKINLLSLFFLLLILGGCHNGKKVSRSSLPSKKMPAWIINRPVVPGYYTGIGVAKIDPYTGNHVEIAKNNALNDLVSDISVTISSNSVIRQFENSAEFREEFESFSKATIRDNIEGYELVGSWSDDQNYWVYYKLSKQHYRSVKERKLERAKALAYDLYSKAKVAENTGDIATALSLHLKALNALRYHLDEELSIVTEDGKIYLANELLAAVIQLFGQIEIKCDHKEIYAKIAQPLDSNIFLRTQYKTAQNAPRSLYHLPLRIYFSKGTGELTQTALSDETGNASFKLGRVTGNQNFQEIMIQVDLRSMMESEDSQSELLGELISLQSSVPSCRLHLLVSPLLTYYVARETEFGEASRRNAMSNEIKTYLAGNFFTFTDSIGDADVKVVLESRAVKGNHNSNHNLYTVFMDTYLSIYDARTQHKIYYKGFDQVRGQQVGSWENALKEAQLSTLERIRKEILPEIHQLDF